MNKIDCELIEKISMESDIFMQRIKDKEILMSKIITNIKLKNMGKLVHIF